MSCGYMHERVVGSVLPGPAWFEKRRKGQWVEFKLGLNSLTEVELDEWMMFLWLHGGVMHVTL